MQLHEKFKEIRKKLLKMSQSELAMAFDATQKDISLLENGKKEFIPNRYLEYLTSQEIDLNSLFNPKEKVCKRECLPLIKKEKNVYFSKMHARSDGTSCWIAKEDDLEEKAYVTSNFSEDMTLEKVMEVLYGIRALLNTTLKKN